MTKSILLRALIAIAILLPSLQCHQQRKSLATAKSGAAVAKRPAPVEVDVAALKLPAMFSDHMVLQREMEVPVWGKATPGQTVTVEYAGKKVEATADEKGDWATKLPPLKVGNATSLTITGQTPQKPIVFTDVLVGDVWVCSGQSNMQFELKRANNGEAETAKAKFPNMRFFQVARKTSLTPTKEMDGKWDVCTPESAGGFSAVAYFFGRELLAKQPEIPIGLIHNSWGGMPVESFMSEEAVKANPDFKPLLDRKARAATEVVKGPAGKERPENAPQWASNIYNKMVYPLLPYAIKGAIWYQGESNAGRAEQYRKLFPAMIRDWRAQWKQGDFPFLFVQLANYGNGKPRAEQPGDSTWAELREAQTMTLAAVPKTGMAVIVDVGDNKDIHPKNKQDVGKRLAIAAQKVAYNKDDAEFSGPIYREMQIDGDKVRIKLDHAKGLKTKDSGAVKGFQIAGEDKKFAWADAKIDGEDVVVSSDSIKKPAAVRYGWADDPAVSLYNAADLPASPFRTDDWPMVTAGKK
ncbi:MAG: sialate O-acetylesterase [Humisphaera sp.]|nr:sialate O-acetylesterase [Humisphaera sp.]